MPERSFAELLSTHRGARRLTQEQLAERAGLSVGAVSLLERGERSAPRSPTVFRLAAALELSPAERQSFAAAARRRLVPSEPQFLAPPELRTPSTTFIGREREVADVTALLKRPDVRFLTMTGPPGAGKTRLALEVAAELAGNYRDGAVAVALGALTDHAQVMPAILQALGLAGGGTGSPLDAVAGYCRERRLLMLLDNLEHLVAVGPELAELLERCRGLQLLATSRAAVHVRAERTFAVRALRLPSAAQQRVGESAVLGSVPAVALFLDRAVAAMPSFRITAENASAVAAICCRLDGLPLALELAAPWVRLLTPQEILSHLDRRLELLVDGPRDLPERQRTMRAALAWSCDLLAEEPRALLRRLSVFQGGAPLDALEAVGQGAGVLPSGALPNLAVLIDHGLVGRHEAAAGESRLTLLETVREYGRELLTEAGEHRATALAHLGYYVTLASRFKREVRTAAQAAWLERFRRELDNVRAALRGAIEHDQVVGGLRLAAALAQFWEVSGHRQEGLDWLSQLLSAAVEPEPRIRAQALAAAGLLAWRLGDHDRAGASLRASLDIFESLGDVRGVAQAIKSLGDVARALGDHLEASRLYEKSIVLLRDQDHDHQDHDHQDHDHQDHDHQDPGDQDHGGLLAMALANLGLCKSRDGDRRGAIALYEEALALHREHGDALGIAMCLTNLGHQAQLAGQWLLARDRLQEAVAVGRRLEAPFYLAAALANLSDLYRERGEVEAACVGYREAMELFASLAEQPGVACCLRCLAWGAWAQNRPALAARLYGAAEALCPVAIGYDVDDAVLHERVRAELSEQLGAAAFAAAYEGGSRLPMLEAVAEAESES